LKCFELSNHFEGQIEALTRMEDYEHLDKLVAQLPDNSPILIDLGKYLGLNFS
jgi:hypothetical protein